VVFQQCIQLSLFVLADYGRKARLLEHFLPSCGNDCLEFGQCVLKQDSTGFDGAVRKLPIIRNLASATIRSSRMAPVGRAKSQQHPFGRAVANHAMAGSEIGRIKNAFAELKIVVFAPIP
jgi:hypothetical protein